MDKIKIKRRLEPAALKDSGVFDRPVWTQEVFEFPGTYDTGESAT